MADLTEDGTERRRRLGRPWLYEIIIYDYGLIFLQRSDMQLGQSPIHTTRVTIIGIQLIKTTRVYTSNPTQNQAMNVSLIDASNVGAVA